VKLYKVPQNIRILFEGEEYFFHHVDGMYSYCTQGDEVVHLQAWAEVEVIPKVTKNETKQKHNERTKN
jgi:hypothetical protein